ncbi:MAG TPA: hypothetical protein VK596_01450 [Edaphobacter sp.]|nr:hypothetical protein [Edaphobacter sp.]
MSESVVVQVRRRRSRVEADGLVLEFEQSGLTRKAFCQRHGIAQHTLDYYRHQRRSRQGAGSGLIVPVELLEPGMASVGTSISGRAPLAVVLTSGRRIEVKDGFDAGLLKKLVAVLEA